MNTKELYSYTGNKGQLYGVRRLTLEEGSGKGIGQLNLLIGRLFLLYDVITTYISSGS